MGWYAHSKSLYLCPANIPVLPWSERSSAHHHSARSSTARWKCVLSEMSPPRFKWALALADHRTESTRRYLSTSQCTRYQQHGPPSLCLPKTTETTVYVLRYWLQNLLVHASLSQNHGRGISLSRLSMFGYVEDGGSSSRVNSAGRDGHGGVRECTRTECLPTFFGQNTGETLGGGDVTMRVYGVHWARSAKYSVHVLDRHAEVF